MVDAAWQDAERKAIPSVDEELTELELDTARFVMSGLIRRYLDDKAGADNSWKGVLELQDNEMPYVTSHPEILSSLLRIYAFLQEALVDNTLLFPYVQHCDLVRALLGRDPANVFGLHDNCDKQMLGFGLYVSASYFNHDCTPNVRKERVGRLMRFYALRDIQPDEELCISYVDTQEARQKRREDLWKGWYFHCMCRRCAEEAL